MPITIKDIYLYPLDTDESCGEAAEINLDKVLKQTTFSRLLAHITKLAEITNQYHEFFYCEEDQQSKKRVIKESCLNHITRLLLPEFSLYTNEPLTLVEFSQLQEAILKMAAKLQENVHLLLSSFAVKNPDGFIFNFVLYVQCGEEPKISSFCKANHAEEDFDFGEGELFSQSLSDEQSDFVSGKVNFMSGLFETITTAGGLQYQQAVDICLDHDMHFAKNQARREIKMDSTHLIPELADHILTSNTLNINVDASIVKEEVVQIDPRRPAFFPITDNFLYRFSTSPSPEIKKISNGMVLTKNFFGNAFELKVAEERKLGEFSDDLKNEVKYHNQKILEKRYTPEKIYPIIALVSSLTRRVILYDSADFFTRLGIRKRMVKNVCDLMQFYPEYKDKMTELLLEQEKNFPGFTKKLFQLTNKKDIFNFKKETMQAPPLSKLNH